MQITIDTNNLSSMDISMLAFLADQGEDTQEAVAPEPEPVVVAPAPVKRAKKATPVLAPVVEVEPEAAPEEDLLGGEDEAPTMSDAVAAATKLVSGGNAAKVKAALAVAGAKRVSEVAAEDLAAFVAALNA